MSHPARLLDGDTVSAGPSGDLVGTVATRLLARLGATISHDSGDDHGSHITLTSGDAGPSDGMVAARLIGPTPTDEPGLPAGTLAYASGVALGASALLAALAEGDVTFYSREVAAQVLLPAVMAASYGTAHREPQDPRPIGDGYVACDLASPDDEDTFERMLESLGPRARDPQAVADEAQLWRLPVCAFEPRSAVEAHTRGVPQPPSAVAEAASRSARDAPGPGARPADLSPPPLDGVVVCDLTAMWAGPLATWLLAALGADVHKIEPSARFDGLRSPAGNGIHPPGADTSRGDASGMFNALNRGKRRHDLDLRAGADRGELQALIADSDLVIDSFSRRVMPNLGLDPERLRALNPDVTTLSMPAFPADHRWQVALGPGIHAATGLGDLGNGRVAAPVVAYPDPLAGLTAFAESLALLLARRRGRPTAHREVTLFGATLPLVSLAPPSHMLADRDSGLGRRLLDDAELGRRGAWQELEDGAGRHRYPRCPFAGDWATPTLAPAPPLASEGGRR